MMPSLRIIVPFHNAAPWIHRCLESIRRQTVVDWTCHLADDCSTDGSSDIARSIVTQDSRFQLTSNPRRLYQCGSFQRILSSAEFCSNDICVSVDADDFLADASVLTRVMDAYADGQTWLTWGNHLWTDGSPGICGPVENAAEIRKVSWRTSHLRTWRLFLWRNIRPQDFLSPDGNPLRVAGDLASMFPMIEMAGDRHIRFIPEINYIYNRSNPESNFRVRSEEQLRNAEFLRSKTPYARLPDDAPNLFADLTSNSGLERVQMELVSHATL
ncbi:MAG: glycosyltransferase family 2 protein [Planctomycetaceae bacterium]